MPRFYRLRTPSTNGTLDTASDTAPTHTSTIGLCTRLTLCFRRHKPSRRFVAKATLFGAIGVAFLLLLVFLPIKAYFIAFLQWLQSIPTGLGAVILTLLYTIALLFILPGTPFNMAAGFLFGMYVGSTVAVIGCDLGAVASFFLGRHFMRKWAERMMETRPKFKALDAAIAKNGFYIIFLCRLSPVFPFGLCNYLFGVTNVSFVRYWLASTLGLLPATIAYTYLGTVTRNLADIFTSSDAEANAAGDDSSGGSAAGGTGFQILLWVSVAATLLVVLVITLVARRALKKAMAEMEQQESGELAFDLENLWSTDAEAAASVGAAEPGMEMVDLEVGRRAGGGDGDPSASVELLPGRVPEDAEDSVVVYEAEPEANNVVHENDEEGEFKAEEGINLV